MKNYAVGIKIYNVFYIGAESQEEAEQKVRELDPYDTLRDCDFNIEYVLIADEDFKEIWRDEDYKGDGEVFIRRW